MTVRVGVKVVAVLSALLLLASGPAAEGTAAVSAPSGPARVGESAELKPKKKKPKKAKKRTCKKKKKRSCKSRKAKKSKKPKKRKKAKKARKVYVQPGVIFNDPRGSRKRQRAIVDHYIRLIDHAARGSQISLSMFRMTDRDVAEALVRAHRKRKVGVRVVLDSDTVNRSKKVYTYLRKELGTSRKRRSWLVICPTDRGCVAPYHQGRGLNHSKFLLFSRTYSSKNVVVQSSANATKAAITSQWNDALTVVSASAYAAYRSYFWAEAEKRTNANYFRAVRLGGHYGALFFPRAKGSDVIVRILDQVRCSRGAAIRVAMGILNRRQIAQKLWEMDDQGCDVQVAMSAFGSQVRAVLGRSGGRHGGPRVKYFTGADHGRHGHSKYLMISANFQGRWRRLVFAGSHSYSYAALRWNDEAMLMTSIRSVYNAYHANFGRVYKAAWGTLSPGNRTREPLPLVSDDANEQE